MSRLPAQILIGDPQQQRLILVEALQAHPNLIRSANPWALADDLLSLFDDLTLNLINLPPDLDTFTARLQQAYGLYDDGVSALGQEASLVFTLWHAWHEQLQGEGIIDYQAAYLLALSNSLSMLSADTTLYLVGFDHFSRAEIDWLKQVLQNDQARLLLHGQIGEDASRYHPDAPLRNLVQQLECSCEITPDGTTYNKVLNTIYTSTDQPLLDRTAAIRDNYQQSPLATHLQVFAALSAEQEARAIDLQVRRWLLAGHRRIGIVTENRRLARRVRALLERANINLQDTAGWALSTTSAAASLERWLECLEEDFAHLPLLDLLKSPFLFPEHDRETIQLATLRLEQDIILHENIARGLERYRTHIRERAERLPDWMNDNTRVLLELLAQLDNAARPVRTLFQVHHPPGVWLDALRNSLAELGMESSLTQDPAGGRLIQALEQMQQAAQGNMMAFSWQDLRTWLGRTLEQFHFQPPVSGDDVYLLGLAQSRLQQFDALIIAGAEREYLPGNPGPSPFFNDTVRRELGLTATQEMLTERFYHFRRLLESAPHILITARSEQDGEPIVASPWLEALQAFHHLAWGEVLQAGDLPRLLEEPASQVFRCDTANVPAIQDQPHPSVSAALLDHTYSPSSYQQLLDCPYQYYAARCLKLAPPEEVRLALSKADYGERVHQCLQAFHCGVVNLLGPFSGKITDQNCSEAIELLNNIASAVFAQDLSDNFEHQGWLQQWQQQIPEYVVWQIDRNRDWQVNNVEVKQEITLLDDIKLRGQLDRVDKQGEALAIIDYKTGYSPKQDEVLAGEAVQLPVYALLAQRSPENPVTEVLYLELKNDGSVKTGAMLEETDLSGLARETGERLVRVINDMRNGKALPAWGDSMTCQWCDMSLLCRHEAWDE